MIYLLALLVPIYVGRVQEMVPSLENLPIAKLGIGLALVVFVGSLGKYRAASSGLWRIPQVRYLAGLFVCALLSVPFSHWPGGSAAFIAASYLKVIVFSVLLVCCVNGENELRILCLSLVATAVLIDVCALANPKTVENGRLCAGGSYDPNDMALVLVIALPTMFYLMEHTGGVRKLLLLACMLLTLVVILKTGSRGGLVALAAAAAGAAWQKGPGYLARRAPLVALVLLLAASWAPQAQLQRLQSIAAVGSDYNATDKSGRIEIWKRGLGIMLDHPLFGCGIAEFADVSGREADRVWLTAHNSLIQLGAEQGVASLACFLLLIRASARSLRDGARELERDWLVQGLFTGFLAFCVGGFFLSWAYHQMTYFLFALSILVDKIARNKKQQARPAPAWQPALAAGRGGER